MTIRHNIDTTSNSDNDYHSQNKHTIENDTDSDKHKQETKDGKIISYIHSEEHLYYGSNLPKVSNRCKILHSLLESYKIITNHAFSPFEIALLQFVMDCHGFANCGDN